MALFLNLESNQTENTFEAHNDINDAAALATRLNISVALEIADMVITIAPDSDVDVLINNYKDEIQERIYAYKIT